MSQEKPIQRQESIYREGVTCDTKKDQLERIADGVEALNFFYGINMNDYYTKTEADGRFVSRYTTSTFEVGELNTEAPLNLAFQMKRGGVLQFAVFNTYAAGNQTSDIGVTHNGSFNRIQADRDLELAGTGRIDVAGAINVIGATGQRVGFFGSHTTQKTTPTYAPAGNTASAAINKLIDDLTDFGFYSNPA